MYISIQIYVAMNSYMVKEMTWAAYYGNREQPLDLLIAGGCKVTISGSDGSLVR
jgi:hypothetical protein